MKYGGKYNIKQQLNEMPKKKGQVQGVATSNLSGKTYEAKIAQRLNSLFAQLPAGHEFHGATAVNDGVGDTPDVEITLANGTTIPIETKTQLGASFGNASMKYDVATSTDNGATIAGGYRLTSLSKMQKAIRSELVAAVNVANNDWDALQACNRITGQLKTYVRSMGLSSTGCGVQGPQATGVINKWYASKEGAGADYIQIGKRKGLYLMPGSKDSLGINAALTEMGKEGLPEFLPSREYVSVRHKQHNRWRATAELKASGLSASPVSLDNVPGFLAILIIAGNIIQKKKVQTAELTSGISNQQIADSTLWQSEHGPSLALALDTVEQ